MGLDNLYEGEKVNLGLMKRYFTSSEVEPNDSYRAMFEGGLILDNERKMNEEIRMYEVHRFGRKK
jgi:hypothetical protein